MIAGDSLVIMNSLLEKEGMAGQVQMVYIDPPYGIKYGSNFQPFIDKRDVKDKKDEDLSQEPEMIKAFRDTWELGIHSYLSYLRDRLLLARGLLADSGSVFIQISDENLHYIRNICGEVFGSNNFVCVIPFAKTASIKANLMASTYDYLIWYAKKKETTKFHQLYTRRIERTDGGTYNCIELEDGTWHRLSKEELLGNKEIPIGKVFRAADMSRQGAASSPQPYDYNGKTYYPSPGRHWAASWPNGIDNLVRANRIVALNSVLSYKLYESDFPLMKISNVWNDTIIGTFSDKHYVVETAAKVVQRCILMTTNPDVRGDNYGNTIYEGEVCIHEPDNPNPEYLKAYINNPKALERFKKSGAKNLSKLLADQLGATSSPSATKAFLAKYGRQPNLFGERVKYLRERIHKTQEDIYTAVGISKSTMIRIENGSSVKEDTAVKIIEQYCNAFHMNVLGYSHKRFDIAGVQQKDLDSIYRESDIVSIHIPLNESTRHMIDSHAFDKMKSDAVLINTSRGSVINQDQLILAIKQGSIGGACLDVYEDEPLSMDNPLRDLNYVILTPHTAGLPDGVKYHKKRYDFFISNIKKVMNGELPECRLNQI